MSVKTHKQMKGLKTQNLRDHMSEAELIFTALAAKTGGRIAKKARLELESKTGKNVVSTGNYLPPAGIRGPKKP